MKAILNIENDAELRQYVKECIKGQVLSVVRGEFVIMVTNELERKIKNTDQYNFNRMMKEALKEAITDILYKEHAVSDWNDSFLKPFIEKRVDAAIANKNWDAMVDKLAKEKVKALIG